MSPADADGDGFAEQPHDVAAEADAGDSGERRRHGGQWPAVEREQSSSLRWAE